MKALGRRTDGRQHDRQLTVVFLLLTIWLSGTSRMSPSGVAGTGAAPAGSLNNITYSNSLVKTKYGPLRGIVFRTVPVVVEGFLGVPYASPPIGSLRYMPPVTPSTWKSPRLVDRFAPVCPQKLPKLDGTDAGVLGDLPIDRLKQLRRLVPTLVNQSEDCLYLNLYVPHAGRSTCRTSQDAVPESSPRSGLNSVVHCSVERFKHDCKHCGSEVVRWNQQRPTDVLTAGFNQPLVGKQFSNGFFSYEWNSGNHYDGSTLAMNGNVIVVTINFRLGVLGFLKTGAKGSAQGNFGLMDLVAGLHWLRENLVAFGGDPAKITLMGHGTGAALANILAVSPVAGDLIHRVVLLSGSALSPWAIQRDPLSVKRKVAQQTSCTGDVVNEDLAPCLRTKSLAELMNISLSSPRFLPGFAPFVDGTVITPAKAAVINNLKIPTDSAIASTSGIEFSNFHKQDVLFGLTTYESYLELTAADLEFGFNETKRDRILRTFVRNTYRFHLNEIYSALKNEYTNWERSPRSAYGYRDAVLELLSDGLTAAPLVQLSHLHSLQGGRSYFLHFKHQSHEWKFPQRSGSVRGEDVPFALGFSPSPMFPLTLTRLDMQVSSTVMRYLCNFVKTGVNAVNRWRRLVLFHFNIHSPDFLAFNIARNPNGLRGSPRMDVFVNSNNKRSWNPAKKPHNETLMRQLLSSFRQQDPLQPRNPLPAIPGQSLLTPEQALMQQQLQQYYHKEANNRQQKHSRRKRTRYSTDFQRYNSGETGGYGSSEESGLPGGSNGNDGQDGDEDDDDRQDGGDSSSGGRGETEPSYYSVDSDYVYSGFTTIKYNLPFWGHYDTTNQVFMEIGSQVVPKSHYRGHKLSLWLSLIPQLHSSFNIPELSMRHHHFSEENAMFYDGLVREQIIEPPLMHIGFVTSTTSKMHKTETIASTILQSISTECPPNITFIQTASASWPLHNSALPAHHGDSNRSLINRLTNSYHRSYSTALAITIGVGCFLLFLNVLIFVAIYYQREKRESNSRMKINLLELESRLNVVESSSGAVAAAAAAAAAASAASSDGQQLKEETSFSTTQAQKQQSLDTDEQVSIKGATGRVASNTANTTATLTKAAQSSGPNGIQTIELSLTPHYHGHGHATSMRRSSTSAIKHSHKCELQQQQQQQHLYHHHQSSCSNNRTVSPKKVSIVSPNPSDEQSSSGSASSLGSDHPAAAAHPRDTRSYSVVSLPKELCNQSTQYDLAEVSHLLVTSTDPAPRPTMTSIATMTRRRDLREDFRSTPAISGSTRSLVTVKDYTHRDGTELLMQGSSGAGILRPPSLHQLHHHPHQHLHHLHQPQQPLQQQQQQQQQESSSNSKKRVQIQEISV
uniref:Carboxylesterase type B domain-containing protein n=1 Tax=Anopheles stephensi TaxID=30069 RepID=A0A182XW06_ANOST